MVHIKTNNSNKKKPLRNTLFKRIIIIMECSRQSLVILPSWLILQMRKLRPRKPTVHSELHSLPSGFLIPARILVPFLLLPIVWMNTSFNHEALFHTSANPSLQPLKNPHLEYCIAAGPVLYVDAMCGLHIKYKVIHAKWP